MNKRQSEEAALEQAAFALGVEEGKFFAENEHTYRIEMYRDEDMEILIQELIDNGDLCDTGDTLDQFRSGFNQGYEEYFEELE